MKHKPPGKESFRPQLMRKILDHLKPEDKQDAEIPWQNPSATGGPQRYYRRSTASTSTMEDHNEGSVHANIAHAINHFVTTQTGPITDLMYVALTQ